MGGFPKRIEFNDEPSLRRYLNDLDETIVINDIIQRYKIKKSDEFKKTVDFLLISNARQYSANSIAASLKSNGTYCATNIIQKWIFYLKEAYVIDEISKYSKKTKRKLDQARKIYDSDVALNSIRVANGQYDLTHNLENIVYNELLFRGYSLSVYDNNGREVDFLAEKDNKKYYVQVAYSVVENKTYSREFSAFNNLSQIDTKIIITNDEIDYSTSNVRHIKLKDFLMTGLD
ncbi:MAG: ATP-binding protein [Erysipelotrichaceae bacterium]|nr:ATP-binding protein [Erysipelotrichaceae bacterium]